MQGFQNFGKDHPAEKVMRWIPPAILGIIGMIYFNKVAPFLITTFDNVVKVVGGLWAAAGAVFATVIIVHLLSKQWDVLSKLYRGFSKKLTRALLKIDPFAYIEGHIETLIIKRKNIQDSKRKIEGMKVSLERTIKEISESLDMNMKKASAAKGVGQTDKASMFASMGATDRDSIKVYQPYLTRVNNNIKLMEKIDESCEITITKLTHEVSRKRVEFKTISWVFDGITQAEGIINPDNEKARLFQESMAIIEETVTEKIAAIDDFEKRSKSFMDNVDIEKQMLNDEGLRLLEEYENDNALFKQIPTVDGEAHVISSNIGGQKQSDFSKFLRK
jgi:hypothetical protein